MIVCPQCNSADVSYIGLDTDDTSICEQWRCDNCGEYWERNCVDVYDFDEPPDNEPEDAGQ